MTCVGTACRTARISAGLTLEGAAERSFTSATTIRAIESGDRVPEPERVRMMCSVYHSREPARAYLRWTAQQLGIELEDAIPQRDVSLPSALLALINRIYAFSDRHRDRDLMAISEDGLIDEEERPLWDKIMEELMEIVRCAEDLRCAGRDRAGSETNREG